MGNTINDAYLELLSQPAKYVTSIISISFLIGVVSLLGELYPIGLGTFQLVDTIDIFNRSIYYSVVSLIFVSCNILADYVPKFSTKNGLENFNENETNYIYNIINHTILFLFSVLLIIDIHSLVKVDRTFLSDFIFHLSLAPLLVMVTYFNKSSKVDANTFVIVTIFPILGYIFYASSLSTITRVFNKNDIDLKNSINVCIEKYSDNECNEFQLISILRDYIILYDEKMSHVYIYRNEDVKNINYPFPK